MNTGNTALKIGAVAAKVATSGKKEEVPPRPQKESKVRIQGYVPKSLSDSFEKLRKHWTFEDQLDDPKAPEWSESEVLEQLLLSALEEEWKELGNEPMNEKDEADLQARTKRRHAEAKK